MKEFRFFFYGKYGKIISKCEKVINIMRCLTGCSWGADRNLMMLMMYKAIIRAILDYRCLAYGSAAKSTLAKLDVVQARALRLAQLVETGEVPGRLRRSKVALDYWIKLKGFETALPSISLLEECWEFEKDGNSINRGSYINSIRKYSEELRSGGIKVRPSVCWSPVRRWLWAEADVDLSIKELKEILRHM